ncbi:hypothetical protein PR048_022823 [Dryococelus australis]|uniref:Uncharacterized protein n=1 Tax=Dryococelus australis TaxID=614101 RepID=A0ABQ9GSE1_9NEOP|nr:hypothetical protein PR048_022823 [Dryococelus australis]
MTLRLDSTILCPVEPQMFVHWLLPRAWEYAIRFLLPCKSAIGSESSSAFKINSGPIAKVTSVHTRVSGVTKTNRTRVSGNTEANTTDIAVVQNIGSSLQPCLQCPVILGTAVKQWLGRSPTTTVIRAQYPSGSLPEFSVWESCWTMPLAGEFSRGTPRVSFYVMSGDDGLLRVPAGKPVTRRVLPRPEFTPLSSFLVSPSQTFAVAGPSDINRTLAPSSAEDMTNGLVSERGLDKTKALVKHASVESIMPPKDNANFARLYISLGIGKIREFIPSQDKIDVQHVYTEVAFAIGLQFIRHALGDSKLTADFVIIGVAVAQWLGRLPPTTVIRAQSPSGSLPEFRMWESSRTMPLVGGFFVGDLPFLPPLHSDAAPFSPQSTLIGCQDLTVKEDYVAARSKSRSGGTIRATLTRTPNAS